MMLHWLVPDFNDAPPLSVGISCFILGSLLLYGAFCYVMEDIERFRREVHLRRLDQNFKRIRHGQSNL